MTAVLYATIGGVYTPGGDKVAPSLASLRRRHPRPAVVYTPSSPSWGARMMSMGLPGQLRASRSGAVAWRCGRHRSLPSSAVGAGPPSRAPAAAQVLSEASRTANVPQAFSYSQLAVRLFAAHGVRPHVPHEMRGFADLVREEGLWPGWLQAGERRAISEEGRTVVDGRVEYPGVRVRGPIRFVDMVSAFPSAMAAGEPLLNPKGFGWRYGLPTSRWWIGFASASPPSDTSLTPLYCRATASHVSAAGAILLTSPLADALAAAGWTVRVSRWTPISRWRFSLRRLSGALLDLRYNVHPSLKTAANAAWGLLAQGPHRYRYIETTNGTVVSGGRHWLLCREEAPHPELSNPVWAVFIAQRVRARLLSQLRQAEREGASVEYVDTDGAIVAGRHTLHPNFAVKGRGDIALIHGPKTYRLGTTRASSGRRWSA